MTSQNIIDTFQALVEYLRDIADKADDISLDVKDKADEIEDMISEMNACNEEEEEEEEKNEKSKATRDVKNRKAPTNLIRGKIGASATKKYWDNWDRINKRIDEVKSLCGAQGSVKIDEMLTILNKIAYDPDDLTDHTLDAKEMWKEALKDPQLKKELKEKKNKTKVRRITNYFDNLTDVVDEI